MKKSNIIVACLCTVTLVAVSFSSGYAAGNNATYKSQGVLRFDNNTVDTADDVIFNANDFSSIDAVVTNGKLDVANALNNHTDSGIATTVIPTFNTLTDAINTIANNGAFNRTLSVSQESVNIPRGFHNGAGKISIALEQKTIVPSVSTQVVAPSNGRVLSSVTVQGSPNLKAEYIKSGVEIFGTTGNYTADATVDENKILASYTAYAKGSKITGKIPSLAAKTWTPGSAAQTISAGNYLSGDQIIAGDANLVPANIAKGKSIFGVSGTAVLEKNSGAHSVPTGKTVASDSGTLTGKTFWNGSSWQNGSMVSKANTTVAATTVSESGSNALITIPTAGYYDTNSKLQVPVETIKKQVSALNSSFDCARMYYSRYYKTKQGYEISLKTGEYIIISLFNGGRGASTIPTIVDCTKVLETNSTFGSTTSSSDGGIVYLQIYQANSNSASITSNANWWNVGCLVIDKDTGDKLFNNYKAVYSYRNYKTSQIVSYNESINKNSYIIVPTLVGGREGYICPEITNCDLVLCTPLITGNLTSSSDGGITGIEIYKARDNASIVGTASWWNTTAIITY